MKNKMRAILRKLCVLLAVTLLFTALAVPAWADDGDVVSENDGATTVSENDDATGNPVVYAEGDEKGTDGEIQPKEGTDSSSSSSTPENPTSSATDDTPTDVPVSGDLYVTGYTVLTGIGGVELQRIEPGQKCTVIISVADTRFVNFTGIAEIKTYLGVQSGSIANATNVKVTSTASFASPSLDHIYTTDGDFNDDKTLRYAIVLDGITYRGGENTLSLDIGYNRGVLELKSVSQPISQCYDADTVEEPKDSALVLTSASYGGGSVEAGSDFTLTVDVLAPAKYAGAENVKVIITPPEQFTASSGSTMIYVGDMAPGASRQVTFELNASAVAPSGSYPISVSVSGTAANGAAPSDQMSVTVPVTQPERFEISRTDLPEYLSMGEEGYAYVSFVNKGKGTIYNVSAEITGEGITTTEGNQYIGNVLSGSESSADFTIQTAQAGTISALLTITYEDEKGNIKELTQDFTITVEEMYMGGFDDYYPGDFGDIDIMPEEEAGMPLWGWILIVLGVLAAGGGAAFFIIKKKKAKKKAAQLTEDDDEDI